MERREDILELLKQKKRMSVEELCARFYCSPATMRRELTRLETAGAIRRVRGGAVIRDGSNFDYSAHYRMSVNLTEKRSIAALAGDFLTDGQSLFLDSSSTCEQLCPYIAQRRNMTIVTNGIYTSLLLNDCDTTDVYILGGHIDRGSHTVLGEYAGGFADNFRADIAFVSCRGIDRTGASEAHPEQALVKRHMLRGAKTAILLADHTKFGQAYLHRLQDFSAFRAVITDREPEGEIVRAAADAGCEVVW